MSIEQDLTDTVLDYIEGWYGADAARMDRALSPQLAKRHRVSEEELRDVDAAWIIRITGEGRGRLDDPSSGRKEIAILDRTETMASVKLVSEEFVDYMHLVKMRDGWRVVNVVWDYHGETEA